LIHKLYLSHKNSGQGFFQLHDKKNVTTDRVTFLLVFSYQTLYSRVKFKKINKIRGYARVNPAFANCGFKGFYGENE